MSVEKIIDIQNVAVGYGQRTVLENLNFSVNRGEIFGILGGSGCGKSTVLKTIIGLYKPLKGKIEVLGGNLAACKEAERRRLMQRFGVTYQGGALLGALTVLENVELPLEEFSNLGKAAIRQTAMSKLELVGLADFADFMPGELSGGMMKRAGLARALARDPELLFFDEPSAGLDPITAAELDKLILSLRDTQKSTIVIVTHELESIFSIIDRVVILDKTTKGILDSGDPRKLRVESDHEWVRRFLNRDGMTLLEQQQNRS